MLLQLDILDPQMKLPKRIRSEAINNRAKMFIAVDNMEQAYRYLEIAITVAAEIGSILHIQEVVNTFKLLKSTWPDEKPVQALGDLFIQLQINHVH